MLKNFQNATTRYLFAQRSLVKSRQLKFKFTSIFNVVEQTDIPIVLKRAKQFKYTQDFYDPLEQLFDISNKRRIRNWLIMLTGGIFTYILIDAYGRKLSSNIQPSLLKSSKDLPQKKEDWATEYQNYVQTISKYDPQQIPLNFNLFKRYRYVIDIESVHYITFIFIFAGPIFYFLATLTFKPLFNNRISGLLALGACYDGLYRMMDENYQSKLKKNEVKNHKLPPERIILEQSMLYAVYGGLLWNILTIARKPQEQLISPEVWKGTKKFRIGSYALMGFITLNLISGQLLGSFDTRQLFRDWPLFNKKKLPDDMFSQKPLLNNFYMNSGLAQLNHRSISVAGTFGATAYLLYLQSRFKLLPVTRTSFFALLLSLVLSSLTGIVNLTHQSPAELAIAHNFSGLLLLTASIYLQHTCRLPCKGYIQYIEKFLK